ncbi:MAG: endonuclease III, partial [Dehalococcoidia bacterium]
MTDSSRTSALSKPTRRRKRPRAPLRLPISPPEIMERLAAIYGPVVWEPRYNALDELIFTVLTQHTSDLNAERAFESLRSRMPTWMDVIEADATEVADAIRHGGLANQKSVRIQQILAAILERHGRLELEFLGDLPLGEAKAWLRDLPGVGPKTTAVVLSFSLGMPAMPVDTHIHRVAKRLGLITLKTSADDAHDVLENLVPPEDRFVFHVLLITHGRRICKAPRP